MKVICINTDQSTSAEKTNYVKYLKYGETYSVEYETNGSYKLLGIDNDGIGWGDPQFHKKRFIPQTSQSF